VEEEAQALRSAKAIGARNTGELETGEAPRRDEPDESSEYVDTSAADSREMDTERGPFHVDPDAEYTSPAPAPPEAPAPAPAAAAAPFHADGTPDAEYTPPAPAPPEAPAPAAATEARE